MVAQSNITREKEALKVTIVGAGIDFILGVLKVIVGVLANSHALLIDGIHSFSDLLSDGLVIVVTKLSHAHPDEEHPYGHGRIETVGTAALGAFLMALACVLLYDGITRLTHWRQIDRPGYLALVAAAISIFGKEIIYRYTYWVGKRIDSELIKANAWHSRSDALSSLAVFFGIAGATVFKWPWLDLIAALVVAIMIGKVGWSFIYQSTQQLIDRGLDRKTLKAIKTRMKKYPGVVDFHNLRSRMIGHQVFLDVNLQVDPLITVSEGHEISHAVAKDLARHFPKIADITIHADFENDMIDRYHTVRASDLPLRDEVLGCLQPVLSRLPKDAERIDLHYINGKITIEINSSIAVDLEEIGPRIEEFKNQYSWAEKIILWQKLKQF